MPTYIYTSPDGRKVKVSGETPPTPQQLEQIFKQAGVLPASDAAAPKPSAPTWSDKLGLNTPTASPAVGFLKGSGAAAVDMAEGAASGLANTVFQGGDMIRRGLGMERVIDTPEAQQAMAAPGTFAGSVGRFAEQGAEFAYPLSKVSKSAAALSWLPRMAIEGGAGAATVGVQSGGDPGAMTVGALLPAVGSAAFNGGRAVVNGVRSAAAAAGEEGIGGAVASLVRNVVPAEPKGMLVQALKPRNSQVNFARTLNSSLPEIKAAETALGRPINGVDDLVEAAKLAKKNVRAQYDAIAGPRRAMGATLDMSSVADAIESSIPRKVQIQDPTRADAVRKLADTYRTSRFSLDDAETLLRETNAELESYYNKFPAARGRAAVANPDTAQLVSEATALRKAIYDSFGDGSEAAREFQRRYGALMELEDTALRRANVAARQQPESLSEQVGKVRAAADMARGTWRMLHGDLTGAADIAAARAGTETAKYLKDQQTSDALVRRALAAFKGESAPVVMPTAPRIAGELPPANTRLGASPDPSYVRAVPGEYASVERPPAPPRKALPPPARQMPPAPDTSYVKAADAERQVVRDPKTGRMKRVYLSTPK